jgi:hypothetical protein
MSNLENLLQQGCLVEIPLLKDCGYAYAKIILPYQFNIEASRCLILKVFDYHRDTTIDIKTINFIEDFNSYDLLTNPLLLLGTPKLRGKDKCKILGYLPLRDEDFILPDFKIPFGKGILISEYEDSIPEWFVVSNLDVNKAYKRGVFPYEKVKHLEIWQHNSYYSLRMRITMEWLRKEGKKIEDYFDLDLPPSGEGTLIKVIHNKVRNSIPYCEIPKEIRGKVIE